MASTTKFHQAPNNSPLRVDKVIQCDAAENGVQPCNRRTKICPEQMKRNGLTVVCNRITFQAPVVTNKHLSENWRLLPQTLPGSGTGDLF